MENVLIKRETFIKDAFFTLLGALFLVASSFVKIPFYPVSFTGHTLAVFILALMQTRRVAISSTLLYLAMGTLSLPVFAGRVNSLWFLGPYGGYYLAFPFAAYLISKARHSPYLAIFLGQIAIYTLGFLGLAPFVGYREAFVGGVVIFIPSMILKMVIAVKIASQKHVQ